MSWLLSFGYSVSFTLYSGLGLVYSLKSKGNTILYLCLVWINTILDFSGYEILYANIENFAEMIILIFDLIANFDALSYNRYVKTETNKISFILR